MAFKFNFGDQEDPNQARYSKETQQSELMLINADATIINAEDHHIKILDCSMSYETINHRDTTIKHISAKAIEDELAAKNSTLIDQTKSAHSDLLPGVYEGGLKIWECSLDLLEFLIDQSMNFEHFEVLEIGCGAGLPGIYAYLKGANVTFQDYNHEVLNYVTIPNVLLNTQPRNLNTVKSKCAFISGDWSNVYSLLQKEFPKKFDLILTSETIYNLSSQKKLITLMKGVLKDTGVIYVAAKTFYFGVGGGTREFEDFIAKDGLLESTVCKVIEDGVQREILKLTIKK